MSDEDLDITALREAARTSGVIRIERPDPGDETEWFRRMDAQRSVSEPEDDAGPMEDDGPVLEERKNDASKLPWHLLPWGPTAEVVSVLEFGSRKYGENNWQLVPLGRIRYFSAAMRHITRWWMGENLDPESGLPHLAHAACSLLFLMWIDRQPTGVP